jgi:hypothetical protein
LATNGTQAFSINTAGQIVGQYFNASGGHGFLLTITPNPPPPAGTTAVMILRGSNASPAVESQYEIYDIGNNAILAAYQLGQVGTDWQFSGLGGVSGGNSTMLLRNSGTGGFELYGISNNIDTAAFLGTVGLDWQFAGFGNFSSLGQSDMILRNGNTGALQVYDIANEKITNTAALGTVGLNWQVGGFGDFSSRGTSDMIMRNSATGGLQVYDIDHNQITGTAFLGTVGSEWRISGVGNFSSKPGESDVIMRNTNTGGLEVYNIANNQITGSAFLGTVGLDWQFAGVAQVQAAASTPAHSRSTTSPTTKSQEPPAWVRWAWSGSLAVSRPIPRPAPWVVRTAQPLNSCKRWPVSAVVAAQPTA